MIRTKRPRGVIAGAVAAVLVVGCGAKVPPGQSQADTQPGAVGNPDPAATSAPGDTAEPGEGSLDGAVEPGAGQTTGAGSDDGPGQPVAPAPGGTSGHGSTGAPSEDPGSDTAGGGHDAAVASGPGVTDEEIFIGIQVAKDLQSDFAVVGAEGDAPDERVISQALVDHLNANGGLRGRRIVPVFHATDATSGTWASQAQAACSTFTEDHEVFAVISSVVGGNDSLLACLAPTGTPLIELNGWAFDQPYFDQHRGVLYQPGRMLPDRWVRAYVDGLARMAFFDGATVGLVRFDAPVFGRLADGVLKPALTRHGVELAEEAVISSPSSVSDFGNVSAQISNAILRFRSAGVDHVLMLENASILPFLFMPQAESQGYRPTYGVTSQDQPDTIQRQGPEEQVRNTVGIGWSPALDVYTEDIPAGNSNATRCFDVMDAGGISNQRGYYVLPRCGAFFFLETVVNRAPDLTRRGFLAGVEQLGDAFLAPSTMGSTFGPGKYSGADVVRPFAFFDDCLCFRYTDPPYRPG